MTYCLGQVAAERLAGAGAQPEVEPDQEPRGVHRGPRGGAVEGDRAAGRPSEDEVAGDRDPEPIRIERRPGVPTASRAASSAEQPGGLEDRGVGESGVAGGAGDPAPVRVAAVDRGLDQRRRDDGPGHRPRRRRRRRAR